VQYHPAGTTSALKADLLLYDGAQAEDLLLRGVECIPSAKWPLSHVQWHMFRHALTE
jgi:hypothetical protein